MKADYTHIVSSNDKSRKQLSLDILNAGVDPEDTYLYTSFTAAAAKLNDSQVKTLEDKGYSVEKNQQQHTFKP